MQIIFPAELEILLFILFLAEALQTAHFATRRQTA